MSTIADARAAAQELPQALPHLLRGYWSGGQRKLTPMIWCEMLPGFSEDGGASLFVVTDAGLAKCKRCLALRDAELVERDRQLVREGRGR